MKTNLKQILATLLTLVLIICAVLPQTASAASRNHDGKNFTVKGSSFVKQYTKALKKEGLTYTKDLIEDFSDDNCSYYSLFDKKGNNTMDLCIYTDHKTKKVEAVRLFFDPRSCSDSQETDNMNAMILAYEVLNRKMTDKKWEKMFTSETFYESGSHIGFCGEFDGVTYLLRIAEETVEFYID